MKAKRSAVGLLALAVTTVTALAQGPPPLPAVDDKPLPLIDAQGPSAAVYSLVFADGETLYTAGLDKVVRVWGLQKDRFVVKAAYRVPIGPGNVGAVNAVALSPDGKWLAMAGRAPIRGESGFRDSGVIVESAALSPDQNRDAGTIYVASTANPAGGKVLRGHRGSVRALAFAPAAAGKPPLLVSAAVEREGGKVFGGMRLWDVASGKSLADCEDLPPRKTRPGLAVWRAGEGAAAVRVAVAWPEAGNAGPDYLRLWDAAAGAAPRKWNADRFTMTAALLRQDGGAKVLTGGLDPANHGRLRAWSFGADQDAPPSVDTVTEFPPLNGVNFRPVALAVVPANDGPPRHAAALLQPSAKDDFHLALVDLSSGRVAVDLPLTDSERDALPSVAANGRYVAVAAGRDHRVRVYDLGDLLRGKTEPMSLLSGDGVAPRKVAFVDKGRGLWLSTDEGARPLSDGLLFDLAGRRVRANDRADLAPDAPQPAGWSFAVDKDRRGVRVWQGDKALPTVRLRGADESVTTAELRPPAGGRPGVLAVAYQEREAARTLVMLCDPLTGKPYRLLVGHLQDVCGLAFSASRPLLASVAHDQTVCVWGLADLDKAVGAVGGLVVADKGKDQAVVLRIEPGSAAAGTALAEGDVLEGVGAPGSVKPVKNATDFDLAVSTRRPGEQVEIAVAGKGALKLPVERGVDERKPLFSLFMTKTNGLPEWVGWSPAGPYDYSNPEAEKHLGWHTNTGDPAAPVSFAPASAYRKDYFREGILRYLADEVNLGRALKKWDDDHPAVPVRPSLRPMRPEGSVPGGRVGEYFVRQGIGSLRVGINDDYVPGDKHRLDWRLTRAGGKGEPGSEYSGEAVRDGREWRVDLSGAKWRSGEYTLRLALRSTSDAAEPLATETVLLRYQPPAPKIELLSGDKPLTGTEREPLKSVEDRLELSVAVGAAAEQEVELIFARALNGLATPAAAVPAVRVQKGPGTVRQVFKLQEGLNRLTVRAVNRGALAGQEDKESATAEARVSYRAPHELPPRFSDLRLDPEPEVRRRDGLEAWVVDRPAARLTGKIEGSGVLVRADWSAGGRAESVLPAGEVRNAEFAVPLQLAAGEEREVRVQAQSRHSDVATEVRRIVFHPRQPTAVFDPLDGPDVLIPRVTLSGTVQPVTQDAFALRLRVAAAEGDSSATFEAKVDAQAGTWKAEVTLFPGVNIVEAIVSNKWRGERPAERALRLRYRRPPLVKRFPEKKEAVGTNKVSLSLLVEGPVGRPLTAVRVDGKPVQVRHDDPVERGGKWQWEVELPEVFVNDGDRNLDRVAVCAVTEEGASPEVVIRIEHKESPRPPRAFFVSPGTPETARRPEYQVVYRVESERPLQRVEILRGDEVLHKANVAKAGREGPLHTLEGKAVVTLTNGTNRLRLVAVNTDGKSPEAEAVVSYTEPAVLVTIDAVQLRSPSNEVEAEFTPVCDPTCEVRFEEKAPRSLVWLVGRVRWSDPKAKALDDRSLRVVAKVGDCRQFPVELGPRGTGEAADTRPFRVPLILIGAENRVSVDLPSIGQQQLSRREFTLRCAAPVRKQRLHVLVVGIDVKDRENLKKRVFDALAVDPGRRPAGSQGNFDKDPPFETCVLHGVLTGYVKKNNVEAQLVEINKEITRLKQQTGWLNDLVLIYYQGADVKKQNEIWLMTSENMQFSKVRPEEFAIPCHRLPSVPGTELLVLNVAGTADAQPGNTDWNGESGTGLIRYAFQQPLGDRKADAALLDVVQEAVRKKGNLGEVAKYLKVALGRQGRELNIILDPEQQSRQLHDASRP
jgi:WD40 repeat protein